MKWRPHPYPQPPKKSKYNPLCNHIVLLVMNETPVAKVFAYWTIK